jgi:acyl-CoA thioesterase FadM
MPIVSLDVRWHAPSRLADVLAIDVGRRAPGRASIDFAYEMTCRGERRMSARTTQVQTRRDTGRSTPIVEPMRGRLMKHFVDVAERAFE